MTVEITYFGHSAFQLTDGALTVLIDPFLTGNPVAVTSADSLNANTILITHAHNDHVGDAPSIARRTGATIITINELANHLKSKGLEKVIGGNHGGTIAFEGGSVKFTQAWHSSAIVEDGKVLAPGVPAGLIVRFGGAVIYFAGDTALFGDMQLIGEEGLDVAVLPIGDHFTMGPADAVRAAKFLKASTVIPCHYNTFPPIKQDGAAFKATIDRETDSTAVVLEPGESFTVGAGS